jgi:hypothetical protein
MEHRELEALSSRELRAGIGRTHATMAAAHAELLSFVHAFDAREAWKADGAIDMAQWLVATLHVGYRSAQEWVRTSHALKELPTLSEAFSEGRLGVESMAAATKLATPDTDAHVTAEALSLPAELLQAAARRKESLAAQSPKDHAKASLRYWFDNAGWCRFSGWLPPEPGARVIAALERAETDDGPDPETGDYDPPDARAAEALATLASAALAADADPDRATVVVHVPVEALVSGEGCGELAAGMAVPAEVVRRLACDARVETVVEGPGGLVGIGPASRVVPPWLSRYLKRRDRTCRFPGCGRRRHLHAHHIVHWANGGPTDAPNMVMICGRHHRFIHDQGWRIAGTPEPGPGLADTLVFLRPDGTPYQPDPEDTAWEPGELSRERGDLDRGPDLRLDLDPGGAQDPGGGRPPGDPPGEGDPPRDPDPAGGSPRGPARPSQRTRGPGPSWVPGRRLPAPAQT